MFGKFGRKNRNVIQYNYNTTNEIDYEKLGKEIAKSIVIANEEIEKKNQKSSRILTAWFAVTIAVFFWILSAISAFGSIMMIRYLLCLDWTNISDKFVHVLICVALILVMFFVAVIFIVSGVEIYKEKDRNFVMSAFSSVIGFTALIVSLIALINEVS